MANFSSTVKALFENNAVTTIAGGGITDVGTTLVVTDGSVFPSISGSNYFMLTMVNASGEREIVKCTDRSGNSLTIVRSQEGTTARAYSDNDIASHRLTAGVLEDIIDDLAEHEGDVTTNAANITTNTADIATNTADIATNTADIATNTAAIAAMGLNEYSLIVQRESSQAYTQYLTGYASWNTVKLSDELVDQGSNVSLNTDTYVMTVEAGTYDVKIRIPIITTTSSAVGRIVLAKLYDHTGSADLLWGAERLVSDAQGVIRIEGQITLAAQSELTLRVITTAGYPSHYIYLGHYGSDAAATPTYYQFTTVEMRKYSD